MYFSKHGKDFQCESLGHEHRATRVIAATTCAPPSPPSWPLTLVAVEFITIHKQRSPPHTPNTPLF